MKVKDILGVNKQYLKQRGPRRQRRIGKSLIKEGGAMDGVGPIHVSEIEPTLKKLESVLGIDLINNTLGSVGKKEFSGDIDVALNITRDEIPTFIAKLNNSKMVDEIKQSSVIMTKVAIANYDESLGDHHESRTGYVQIDFMMGDPEWLKTYYHSPHEDVSKYKGQYRNLMIATISQYYNAESDDQTIPDGRPVQVERFMWSPANGLSRVLRRPAVKKNGDGYTKKNENKLIDGPWQKPDEIAATLGLGTGEVLDSFETLYAAVRANYTKEIQIEIFSDFANNEAVQDIGVPDELAQFDNSTVVEAIYDGNIGMQEMMAFFKIATAQQRAKLQQLVKRSENKAAWNLLKHVTGIDLKDI